MTKEVYIYISLFVAMLGYLVYMDYRDKTAAYPSLAEEVISGEDVYIPYNVPQLSKRGRDALENPKEGTTIYFMGDRKSPPRFQVFRSPGFHKELRLPPEWTDLDNPTNADQIKVPPILIRKICVAPGCDSTAILGGFCGKHIPKPPFAVCPVCGKTTFLCPEHCGNSPCVHGASGEKHKLGCLLSLSPKELEGLKKYYEENK